MKTSQKEGVSDRPPNTRDLPKHEASQLGAGRLMSVRRKWTPYKPVRILALLPFRSPTDAERYDIPIAIDVETRMTDAFLSYRLSSLSSAAQASPAKFSPTPSDRRVRSPRDSVSAILSP